MVLYHLGYIDVNVNFKAKMTISALELARISDIEEQFVLTTVVDTMVGTSVNIINF